MRKFTLTIDNIDKVLASLSVEEVNRMNELNLSPVTNQRTIDEDFKKFVEEELNFQEGDFDE